MHTIMHAIKRVTGDLRLIRNKDSKVEGEGEERKKCTSENHTLQNSK
jgi:hypothetical protein